MIKIDDEMLSACVKIYLPGIFPSSGSCVNLMLYDLREAEFEIYHKTFIYSSIITCSHEKERKKERERERERERESERASDTPTCSRRIYVK